MTALTDAELVDRLRVLIGFLHPVKATAREIERTIQELAKRLEQKTKGE